MKTAGVFMVLTLVLLCCFSGVAFKSSESLKLQNYCSAYPEPPKGQTFLCKTEYRPVCGTNGVTHNNKWFLCLAKWQTGGRLSLQHEEVCMKKIDCSIYQQTKNPRKIVCQEIYRPVCGTDGVTYDNNCMLCAKILNGASIGPAHLGQCRVKDDCGEYQKPRKGQHVACAAIYRPVCGTNGITYSNKCNFCAARWKTGLNIRIKHEGRCNRKIN